MAPETAPRPAGPRPRLLVTRRLPDPVEARLQASFDVTLNLDDRPLTAAELKAALVSYDALCPTITDRIDAGLLAVEGRSVGLIANFGAGVEHIDLDAARSAGVAISNTPDALTAATAELALMLMLMASRRAGEGERQLRAGQWRGWAPTHLLGSGLAGKTLGLVGFGRIGQATAALALAMGLKILYFNRTRADAATERRLRAERAETLDALLARADIVSLHMPGGDDTRHLMNAERIALMKPNAILVNSARGSLIDESAAIEALRQGRIRAGLDVFENEPRICEAFMGLENVVLLPHLGSATVEARVAMGMQAADNLDAFFRNDPVPNRVA